MSMRSFDSPFVQAATLSRLHQQAVQSRLGPHNVTAAQFPVLELLWERDGQTQSSLCKRLKVEQPTLANTLSRMVRDKLVRKVRDTNDRRQIIIRLTRRGQDLREVLTNSVNEVLSTALHGIDPARLLDFAELCERMSMNLRSDLDQSPVMLDDSLALPENETSSASTNAADAAPSSAPASGSVPPVHAAKDPLAPETHGSDVPSFVSAFVPDGNAQDDDDDPREEDARNKTSDQEGATSESIAGDEDLLELTPDQVVTDSEEKIRPSGTPSGGRTPALGTKATEPDGAAPDPDDEVLLLDEDYAVPGEGADPDDTGTRS